MEKEIFTKPGAVEYQMPKAMAEDLAKASGKSKNFKATRISCRLCKQRMRLAQTLYKGDDRLNVNF